MKKTHDDQWEIRAGQVVPEPKDITLGASAVTLTGTVLYADLRDSTGLVRQKPAWFAAEVYKNYLYCAARIIRAQGGTITAYDGDRIMAVFLGDSKNTQAVAAGLKLHWADQKILTPAITAKYAGRYEYTYRQRVGIDTSELFIARTGIRGSNDLVWVGNAANNAAKMAALATSHSTLITPAVYNHMARSVKFAGDPQQNMWKDLGSEALGHPVYGCSWMRSL